MFSFAQRANKAGGLFCRTEVGEHFGLCGIITRVPQSNTVQPARAQ
jgi:hypothetical protein